MTRVPREDQDELVQAADSQHIVILRDGAIVAVPIYTEVMGLNIGTLSVVRALAKTACV